MTYKRERFQANGKTESICQIAFNFFEKYVIFLRNKQENLSRTEIIELETKIGRAENFFFNSILFKMKLNFILKVTKLNFTS